MSSFQALRGYTADAAFASFREKELGVIAQGFYADLTILDRDILTVDPAEILQTSVLGTVVGGRVVHAKIDPLASLMKDVSKANSLVSKVPPRLQDFWKRYARDMAADHGGDIAPSILV